nr:ankyrin repeat domain-containing protein 7-like [Camelus dromedarius]
MKKGLEEVGESSCGTCGCWAVRGEDCELLVESAPEPRAWLSRHDSELKQLHRAACVGGSYTVEELLSCKKNLINSRDRKNRTALHLACTTGQSSVVALLIQWNCDLDACDKESKAALIKAVQCQNDGCVTVLLEHGADPNLEDDSQNTALHYVVLAENTSIATQLLRCNANLEAINEQRQKMVF